MNDAVAAPSRRCRRNRKTERVAPFDMLRRQAARQHTYHERLAFAVVGMAIMDARGIATNEKRRREALAWLRTEQGRGMCIIFNISAEWVLRVCDGERKG